MTVVLTSDRAAPLSNAPALGLKFGFALGLVGVADFFFYGRDVGVSLPIFLALVAAGLIATGTRPSHRAAAVRAGLLLPLGLLPMLENVSALSVAFGFSALAVFGLAVTGRLRHGAARMTRQVAGFLMAVPFRFIPDMLRWRIASKRRAGRMHVGGLAGWILPIGLGIVFVLLFGLANPIIEQWLDMIAMWRLLEVLTVWRVGFWLLVLAIVWGFLRPRISWFQRPRQAVDLIGPRLPVPVASQHPVLQSMLSEAAMLRALIVFNALFAVETVLDIAYLWGGLALPDGMTYAAYAHRGAYPLIVTALLAAGFVLVATRNESPVSRNRLVRGLIYVWTAQNVMLVVSSILRLDIYVNIYALTYWRAAAFIWMGLVALGLLLIIARIALGRSNDWLLSANLLTLSATLYACGFINFAALIANWNVDHRPGQGETAVFLDISYLTGLGPQAIPAIDRLLGASDGRVANWNNWLRVARNDIARDHGRRMEDWRARTFRDWRLKLYLHQHDAMIASEGLNRIPGQ